MNRKAKYFFFILFGFASCALSQGSPRPARPNVILILTDDQGYGDLGFHQNPDIKTPVLDDFAAHSIRFTHFYVSPVCAPTRASILTGRYNIRTGVFDTFSGGAIMATQETTLPEIFRSSGYATGHFGKWHLGDSYPSRPQDQGFDTSVWNMGGGIGGEGDIYNYYQGDSSYFNPVLWKNGKKFQSKGYCTDVFTDEAIQFITQPRTDPFFVYLAYNAPHKPLQLPESYYNQYKGQEIDPGAFRRAGYYTHDMSEKDKEDARKVYGMVTNIDDNVGRLLAALKAAKLDQNTIVIFMTDNGPAQNRFTGGFRGKKSMVSEGGIHVPFYLQLPPGLATAKQIDAACAHIDLLPTLADLCGVSIPVGVQVDGKSLVPLLNEQPDPSLAARPLFFEWQRSYPEKYQNMAVIQNGYKLIGNVSEEAPIAEFALYNLEKDPFEAENLVEKNPRLATQLKQEIDRWYADIMASPHILDLPRIIIGNEHQNPVILNRNDARGIQEIRDQEDIYVSWDVLVETPGTYRVSCYFVNELTEPGKLYFRIGNKNVSLQNETMGTQSIVFDRVHLETGAFKIDSWYTISITSYLTPFYLEIEKLAE